MIYQQKTIIPAREVVTEIHVARCLNCDGDDMDIRVYEDDQGPPIRSVTCKKCNGKIKGGVKEWNEHNDPDTIIQILQERIANDKLKIAEMKALKKRRLKEKIS